MNHYVRHAPTFYSNFFQDQLYFSENFFFQIDGSIRNGHGKIRNAETAPIFRNHSGQSGKVGNYDLFNYHFNRE